MHKHDIRLWICCGLSEFTVCKRTVSTDYVRVFLCYSGPPLRVSLNFPKPPELLLPTYIALNTKERRRETWWVEWFQEGLKRQAQQVRTRDRKPAAGWLLVCVMMLKGAFKCGLDCCWRIDEGFFLMWVVSEFGLESRFGSSLSHQYRLGLSSW